MGMGAAAVGLIPWGKLIGKAIGKFRGAGGAIPELGGDIGPSSKIWVGPKSKVGQENVGTLRSAEKMLEQGAGMKSIKRSTGWEKIPGGPDNPEGHWVYEIPDEEFRVNVPANLVRGADYPAEEVFRHPGLFKEAYPGGYAGGRPDIPATQTGMGETPVQFKKMPKKAQGESGAEGIALNVDMPQEMMRKTGIHELQHVVQAQEGWPVGSSVDIERGALGPSIRREIAQSPEVSEPISYAKRLEEQANMTDDPILKQRFQNQADTLFEKASAIRKKLLNKEAFKSYERQMGEFMARRAEQRLDLTPEERASSLLMEGEIPELLYRYMNKPYGGHGGG
jgi:hypothetical protein